MQPHDTIALTPSITYRPATLADSVQVAALLNACMQAMAGFDNYTAAGILGEWESPGFVLAASTLVAVDELDRIVGYIEVWDAADPPVLPWVWAQVHPQHEGRGIGTYLMQWGEARARQAIERVPPDVRVVMRASTHSSYKPAFDLLEGLDMTRATIFLEMEIALDTLQPEPVWPAGITPRVYDDTISARAVFDCWREAFQDHRGHVPEDEDAAFARWEHDIATNPDADPSLWYLAYEGTEMAGAVICSRSVAEDPELGWIDKLGVRRAWRRRGLGTALLHFTFAELKKRGFRRAGLGVDATSLTGATRLYERAGMHKKHEWVTLEKELRAGVDLSRH